VNASDLFALVNLKPLTIKDLVGLVPLLKKDVLEAILTGKT